MSFWPRLCPRKKGRHFLVIGLGTFGSLMAVTLQHSGYRVTAVDHRDKVVQPLAESIPDLLIADVLKPGVLDHLDLKQYDTVILALGKNIDVSLSIATLLKEAGAKQLIAKAETPLHARLLTKLGVDRVIMPEQAVGAQVATSLLLPDTVQQLEASPAFHICETVLPTALVGENIAAPRFRQYFQESNVIALKRGPELFSPPPSDMKLAPSDILITLGKSAVSLATELHSH